METITSLHAKSRTRPTLRFMLSHPAHVISLGFGSGLAPVAAGTWGTLFAWLSFAALNRWFDRWLSDPVWLALIAATFLLGSWAAQRTGEALGQPDNSHMVVDEIVAFWLVLFMLPDRSWPTAAGAFVLFRFFDIVKPPPIRAWDARFKHGFGVMLDDLVAAFYTLLVIAVWMRVS